jgi:hypothetical protein
MKNVESMATPTFAPYTPHTSPLCREVFRADSVHGLADRTGITLGEQIEELSKRRSPWLEDSQDHFRETLLLPLLGLEPLVG